MKRDSTKQQAVPSAENNEENPNNTDDNARSSSPDKLLQDAKTSAKSDQSGNGSEADNHSGSPNNESGSTGTSQSQPDSVPKSSNGSGSAQGSPKVQFGAGTKERDGSVKGVKKMKRSLRDIVLSEVMATEKGGNSAASPNTGTPQKSILKVRSEPVLSTGITSEKEPLSFVNKAYEGDSDGDIATGSGTKADKVAATAKSAFPFSMQRGSSTSSRGFADVVDLLIQRSSIDLGGRDMHPFGRDCSIEGIMQASRPKSHSKNSAFGKLVIWMTLMSILLGAACGIIFLSENYNARQRGNKLLQASSNASVPM